MTTPSITEIVRNGISIPTVTATTRIVTRKDEQGNEIKEGGDPFISLAIADANDKPTVAVETIVAFLGEDKAFAILAAWLRRIAQKFSAECVDSDGIFSEEKFQKCWEQLNVYAGTANKKELEAELREVTKLMIEAASSGNTERVMELVAKVKQLDAAIDDCKRAPRGSKSNDNE